jgi:hypothetical protein
VEGVSRLSLHLAFILTHSFISYIRRILAADTARFPHPETDPSPSASLAIHHALLWANSMPQEAQDENIDPSLSQSSSVSVSNGDSGAVVDFSTFQFVQ